MKAILLERLHADHYRYQALLCILDRQLHIAACEEIPDYRLLARLCHYLTRQPEEWHHRVEDALFERLAARHPDSRDTLEVLVEEHRRITTYGRELEAAFHRMADETPDAEADANLLNLGQAFSELYHHHLHTENQHIFPLIERQVPAGELDGMTSGIPLDSPAEGSPSFQLLYRQIADHHTGLRLGHGEQADFCPLCDARPAHSS